MTRRGWFLSACAWLVLCMAQAPPLTVADTKNDLTADPWGFLHQALSPWTDIFPLGQLQNQAYGYLFPQGLFFALLSPLPDWLTQRFWWALLLTLAFAGVVKLLEATGTGSRGSRIFAGMLYALSPRILTTLGAISSEAWPVALAPWILLPVVRILTRGLPGPGAAPPSRWMVAQAACGSAVAILCLGAVNAVATITAIIPALVWWFIAGVCATARPVRHTAWQFFRWWAPASILACFWWVGPLLILGRYSPPFTDYIESARVTTHWFNLGEILRGTTHWTPYLSSERQAGAALATQPVFVAGTMIVAVLGLAGLAVARRRLPYRRVWASMLIIGLLIFGIAGPFSPVHGAALTFLDGAGAPLRNLHKFDTLVHLPIVIGVAHLLAPLRLPQRAAWVHPEQHRSVVRVAAMGLVLLVVSAPAWSGRLVPTDGYREVPSYWSEAAAWLNDPEHGAQNTRTMLLPRAVSARQTWGNTRDEPAQSLLDVPWVVRDAVPLVPPEAIRGLDGVQREFDTGSPAPALAQTLLQQGVGYLLVRSDLSSAAGTPGARSVLRTVRQSPGFSEVASFGTDGTEGTNNTEGSVRIFQVGAQPGASTTAARTIHLDALDVVSGGAEVLPRLAAADLASNTPVQDRVLLGDPGVPNLPTTPITITDTPALREHDYGAVSSPDSSIRAPGDPWRGLNPMHDYPSPGALTAVRESQGRIIASSSADDATSFGGSETLSSVSAAVDGDPLTAWYPASGSPVNQSLTAILDSPVSQLRLTAQAQGSPLRVQVTTFRSGHTVASSTVEFPTGRMKSFSLPTGETDRVEMRILSAWGQAGISEFQLTNTLGGANKDVTPRREIIVPTPAATTGSDAGSVAGADSEPNSGPAETIGRWVLGQEIPEGTLRRIITVPAGGVTAQVSTSDCTATTSVDGNSVRCGQRLSLKEGEHSIRSSARWVQLKNTAATTHTETSGARIVLSPSAVNSGQQAHLRNGDTTVALTSVTVNGWQQGWLIPASLEPSVAALSDADLAAAVDVTFPATETYRAWLAMGLGSAILLIVIWLFLLLDGRTQRYGRYAPHNPSGASTAWHDLPHSEQGPLERPTHRFPRLRSTVLTILTLAAWCAIAAVLAGVPGAIAAAITAGVLRWVRPLPILLLAGGIATVLFTRAPWGSRGIADGYAGDSLTLQLILVICLTTVVVAIVAPRRINAPSAPS